MPSSLTRSWRTWLYLWLTYVGFERLTALSRYRIGRIAIRAAKVVIRGGSVHVRGGAGFGLRLSTDHVPVTHIQGYGLVRGVLEPEVQEALRRHVAPGAVVYDIGANIGFFSLLAAALAGPSGRVEAFEPLPANAEAIRANASLNGLQTIRVHQVAVSDRSGSGELCVPVESSWAHLTSHGLHPATEEVIAVELIALDEQIACGRVQAPDVVKVDVEGFEVSVLMGLRKTLARHPVTIVCELHDTNRAMVEFMTELGYSLTNLEGTGAVDDAGPIHVLIRRD